MSLAVLADHMASKGRNGDTMLVHMAPEEVRGLHALAAAHGGELTINPETGLPEANFLKRLLPTIIGAALAATGIGAPMAALMVGGFEAVRTGDLSKGIMAGLGAYGGAGIGSALSGAGSAALAGSPEALAAGQTAASSVAPETISAAVGEGITEQSVRQAAANEAARNVASQAPFYSKLGAGLEGLTSEQGRAAFMQNIGGGKELLKAAYMGATPLLAAEAAQSKMPTTVTQMPVYQNATFDPISQTYIYGPPTRGANGGLMGMASGGVAFESGTTPSYQRTSMSPGMLDFAQRSEPVVRMARGGVPGYARGGFRTLDVDGDVPIFEDYGVDESAFAPLYSSAPTPAPAPTPTFIAAPAPAPAPDAGLAALAAAPATPAVITTPTVVAATPAPAPISAPTVVTAAPAPISAPTVVAAPATTAGLGALVGATTPAATSVVTPSGVVVPTTKLDFATGADVLPKYLGLNAVAAPGASSTIISKDALSDYDYSSRKPRNETEEAINNIYNRVLGRDAESKGLDYWTNAVTSGTLSLTDVEKRIRQIGENIGVSVDPTQLAKPTAGQLAAQQAIFADPQTAALREVQAGINAGRTAQQIADAVNAKYGKSFSAENVLDFIANNKMKAEIPTLFPGTTPGVVTTGEPFTPTTTTMEQVRSDYVKGGGRTDMPTITNILPTDRTYTYNQAFDLLQGYLKANPNALYGDVVAFARSKGIPDMQAKAAYNEFRFSGLTGGSKQAYDYLMGRGAYPVKPFTQTGEIMRPYAESVLGVPADIKTKRFIFDPATQKYVENPAFVPRKSSAQREKEAGIAPDGSSSSSSSSGTGAKVQWSNQATGELINSTEDDPRYKNDPAWSIVQRYARGGLPSLAALGGAAGGGQFDLGSYSDGGRLLRGPGDGVSDSIPATIGGKRPARLADGEFVVPARIVSELGNGSTEAGARKLYAMMDRVQAARRKSIGKGKVAKNTKADKHLPA